MVKLTRYEFQCKALDFKQRILEQYNLGNFSGVETLGRSLTKFVQDTHRMSPEYLNGFDPIVYTKQLVNS